MWFLYTIVRIQGRKEAPGAVTHQMAWRLLRKLRLEALKSANMLVFQSDLIVSSKLSKSKMKDPTDLTDGLTLEVTEI